MKKCQKTMSDNGKINGVEAFWECGKRAKFEGVDRLRGHMYLCGLHAAAWNKVAKRFGRPLATALALLLLAGCQAPHPSPVHYEPLKCVLPPLPPTGRVLAARVAAPPIELVVVGNGPTNVTLAWDASTSPNVTGYMVYYGVAPRSYTNVVAVENTTCELEGLDAPTNFCYFFTVTAKAGYLESVYDGEVAWGTQYATITAQGDSNTNLAQWKPSFWYPSPKIQFFRLRVAGSVLNLQERDLEGAWLETEEPQTNAAALTNKSFSLTISR